MTTIRMRRAAALAVALGCLAPAACGDDGGGEAADGQDFCTEMIDVQAELGALSSGNPEGLDDVVARLQAVEPPSEIADAYRSVVAGYAAMADGDGFTDPAGQEELVKAQEDMAELYEYMSENCEEPAAPAPSG
jgi:hypothetical protein